MVRSMCAFNWLSFLIFTAYWVQVRSHSEPGDVSDACAGHRALCPVAWALSSGSEHVIAQNSQLKKEKLEGLLKRVQNCFHRCSLLNFFLPSFWWKCVVQNETEKDNAGINYCTKLLPFNVDLSCCPHLKADSCFRSVPYFWHSLGLHCT